MPLGWERINVKKTTPNKNIVFIKTLPIGGPDEAISKDFLERIAAQCLPIMNSNHLSVVSLEEYEPNPEFLGAFASLPLRVVSNLPQVATSIMGKLSSLFLGQALESGFHLSLCK